MPDGPALDDRAFVAAVGRVAVRTPTALVQLWEALVDRVEAGYDDEADVYSSDLAVRGSIGRVLDDPQLNAFPQLAWVRERVAAADARLRPLLQVQPLPSLVPQPWWEAHPPRSGGPLLVESFKRTYGVAVAPATAETTRSDG